MNVVQRLGVLQLLNVLAWLVGAFVLRSYDSYVGAMFGLFFGCLLMFILWALTYDEPARRRF